MLLLFIQYFVTSTSLFADVCKVCIIKIINCVMNISDWTALVLIYGRVSVCQKHYK